MPSRSAVVKLKAILIIDLIIVGAALGAYFYLQDQGIVADAPKPAKFILTDLTISPSEAYEGETVAISVNITNIGEVDGNDTWSLLINGVVKDSANMTLGGNSSEIIAFTVIENTVGTYTVQIGDLNGNFTIKEAPPENSKIVLSDLKVNPYESWINEPINVTATAHNPSSFVDKLMVKVTVDDLAFGFNVIELEAGTSQIVSFTVNATTEGRHVVKINTLSGSVSIVKTGYHTLTISRAGGGSRSVPFTLNGVTQGTSYTALLPVGQYTVTIESPINVGTGVVEFQNWNDDSRSATKTFTLNQRLILVANYKIISGYASCPSLYIWNGKDYSYVTDVSNSGWLGYIGFINQNGNIVFSGGNPWDYVKLDKNLLEAKDGYFDITLSQQWDELYYLDSASMLVVDHPIGTNVYTSMTNYLNKGSTGQLYTVSNGTLSTPVSAKNEKGQDVLSQISQLDRVYTPGHNAWDNPSSWNNITLNQLTLDLGNLSAGQQVKLVISGMVDWGSADSYYAWINTFKEAAAQGLVVNGTEITPASYMEVKAANGSWVRAPQDKQIPIPSDYNARTFTVDLTGLFPADVSDYQIRLTNSWNVTYDYIGIDTTSQKDMKIQTLLPTSAVLGQFWETESTASGAFTRYGDVTSLIQKADDMFVVGRQADQVNMQFSTANLTSPDPGMERDYFFTVACWFKDPPGAWGYGFTYTVDPMPFMAMSGFPYPTTESYPYDAVHLAYIQQYNTRIITAP